MTIHEFGKGNPETAVLVHPSAVMWDYFEYVIPLADWLKDHGCENVACIYGCSMGGSVVTRFLADGNIKVRSAVIDGGITPYQLPWIITRFIAIKDFLLISMGKLGGLKILEKAFSTDEYSEEDLQYIVKVLKHMSAKTIWRTFESCNNYDMPDRVKVQCTRIEYWYSRAEERDRKSDIAYIRKTFPQTVVKVFDDIGHGGLAALKPDLLVNELIRAMGE